MCNTQCDTPHNPPKEKKRKYKVNEKIQNVKPIIQPGKAQSYSATICDICSDTPHKKVPRG